MQVRIRITMNIDDGRQDVSDDYKQLDLTHLMKQAVGVCTALAVSHRFSRLPYEANYISTKVTSSFDIIA